MLKCCLDNNLPAPTNKSISALVRVPQSKSHVYAEHNTEEPYLCWICRSVGYRSGCCRKNKRFEERKQNGESRQAGEPWPIRYVINEPRSQEERLFRMSKLRGPAAGLTARLDCCENSTLSIYAQSKFQRTTLSVVLTSIEVDSDSDFRIFWIEI